MVGRDRCTCRTVCNIASAWSAVASEPLCSYQLWSVSSSLLLLLPHLRTRRRLSIDAYQTLRARVDPRTRRARWSLCCQPPGSRFHGLPSDCRTQSARCHTSYSYIRICRHSTSTAPWRCRFRWVSRRMFCCFMWKQRRSVRTSCSRCPPMARLAAKLRLSKLWNASSWNCSTCNWSPASSRRDSTSWESSILASWPTASPAFTGVHTKQDREKNGNCDCLKFFNYCVWNYFWNLFFIYLFLFYFF